MNRKDRLKPRPNTPLFSVTSDQYLYTKGGEFSLNGEEYIGEYHLKSGVAPMTGPLPTPEAQLLRPIYTNKDHYTYDSIKQFNTPKFRAVEPRPHIWQADEGDYAVGYAFRYFVEKVEDDLSYAIEIDQDQYNLINTRRGIDGGIYPVEVVKWQLIGRQQDIYNNNQMEIYRASERLPSVGYAVQSFLEQARITGV